MNGDGGAERFETVIIGGGQAGLSTGHYLAKRGLPFVILDANERVGDSWRRRWDSMRLFTPAHYDGLAGMPFPGRPFRAPTKDEMGDYLESYAARFDLPVRSGVRVERLARDGDRFVVETAGGRLEAEQVVAPEEVQVRVVVPLVVVVGLAVRVTFVPGRKPARQTVPQEIPPG